MSVCQDKKDGEVQSDQGIKVICVLGGSNLGKSQKLVDAASDLGRELTERNIGVLYGGGSMGLRACVARAAYLQGNRVGGIVLKPIAESKVFGTTMGGERKVLSIHNAMAQMLHHADAFIVIPGGVGTLGELFGILSWNKLNLRQKPIGLLNTNGFYNGLLAFLEHVVAQGLTNQATKDFFVTARDPAQLINKLQTFMPPPDPFLRQVKWYTDGEPSKPGEPNTNLHL